ncbi:hypothetical protein TPAR_06716 [Tolypocladium paradoxum]|uniref:NAD(P)-binding protein n=1 Tax=Tolypocladium paradoxum TaxID=94208 RepID=A0A2S4KSD1_9HYPO|nr:hypothetical protein TPAR_06716 [Tolypocladium paradoxum]
MARTIFITGANSGVGLATTKLFLQNGWNVVATARAPFSSDELQRLAKSSKERLLLQSLDLLSPDSFQPALDAAVARFKKVDVLLNNAGYGQMGMMEALTVDDYRRQFEVNVFGVFFSLTELLFSNIFLTNFPLPTGPIGLTKLFLPHLLATADPDCPPLIIYVSSGAAHFGLPFMSAYNASKSALDLFAEAVSYELGALSPNPVKVKLVVPHGGVQSTNFSSSSNSATVLDLIGKDLILAERYGAYAAKAMGTFGQMATKSMPVTRPAERIWEAATDGKTKLRYFVAGEDGGANMDRRFVVKRENESAEDADERYVTSMRDVYA